MQEPGLHKKMNEDIKRLIKQGLFEQLDLAQYSAQRGPTLGHDENTPDLSQDVPTLEPDEQNNDARMEEPTPKEASH